MIFESFSQADGSTTRKFGGTGLGITISKMLVEQMGGQIHLRSVPDQGSEFVFELPFEKNLSGQAAETAAGLLDMPEDKQAGLASLKGVRVLLAEDYKTNQKLAIRQLENAGADVVLCENGKEAVRAFRESSFDIVLMDIQMPKMDGYTACRKIRKLEAGRSLTPVIAMTAHAMKEDRQLCLDAGMNDYLSKPLKKDQLLKTIAHWTGKGTGQYPGDPANPDDTSETKISSIIDLERAVIEFGDDQAFFQEVLDEFISNAGRQIERIRAAQERQDTAVIQEEAHAMKGGASNLTADALSRAAHHLEQQVRDRKTDSFGPLIRQIEAEYEKLVSFRKKQA